jgi:hypothetical protein
VKKYLLLLIVPALVPAVYDFDNFDLRTSNWNMRFCNDGRWGLGGFGIEETIPGSSWNGHNYLFGAGVWIGAIADSDTIVSVGYNPSNTATEFYPTLTRFWRDGHENPEDRVYKSWSDWPPPAGRFPMAPQEPFSRQDLWCCFTDSSPEAVRYRRRMLGVDVCLTVHGFNHGLCPDILFLKYEVSNPNPWPLEKTYIGLALDPDVGAGADDMTGLILDTAFVWQGDTYPVSRTVFACDYDNLEMTRSGEQWTPGAVCVILLQGAERKGLSAARRFTVEYDPITDRNQYLTMAGYDYRTGEYKPFDGPDQMGADKRLLLATGPCRIGPLETVMVWFAVVGSPFGERNEPFPDRDWAELATRLWFAELTFDGSGIALEPEPRTKAQALRVWPNPAQNWVRIQTPYSGNEPVRFYDAVGNLVRTMESGSLVPVYDMNPGIYLVRASASTAKLIVTR